MNDDLIKQILINILKVKSIKNYTKGLKEMPDVVDYLKSKYGDLELSELFYLGLNGNSGQICSYGNKKKFNTLEKGYRFCGLSCSCKKELQSKKIKDRWKNKSKEEKEIAFEKMKKTNLERYGSENVMHSQSIKEKIRDNNIEKYGVSHHFALSEFQEKIKKTNIEKYGVEYPLQSEEIREKIKRTNVEKYGKDHTMHIAQQAFKDQNDNMNPFQVEEIKSKIESTMIEKYGVSKALQSKEIVDKMTAKLYEKYKRKNTAQLHISDEHYSILNDKDKFFEIVNNKTLNEIKEKIPVFEATIVRYARKHGVLDKILISDKSQYETEIAKFLDDNSIRYKRNDKIVLNGLELDFLLSDYPVTIEFNSLAFHSEFGKNYEGNKGKTKEYHSNKTNGCESKGIQLIHIFEDEWNEKKDIIKHKILSLTGRLPKGVGGRQVSIKKIEFSQEKEFLEKYHIQGSTRDRRFGYGAFFKDELISVMVVGKSKKNEWEIKRFASNNKNNPGVFSKMLNHFIAEYNPETVVTFADRRYSMGKMYVNTGFVEIGRIGENYFYTKDYKTRLNKESFQKNKIKKKFNIDVSKKTELELMLGLGYDRIWDAGKIKYEYRNPKC